MASWTQPRPSLAVPRRLAVAAAIVLLLAAVASVALASTRHDGMLGYGQVQFDRHGPEWWAARYRREHARADRLQQLLAVRVREVQGLRRSAVHRTSSLEALHLASIAYHVPFELLYRRASCESTGSLPASPPSERTLSAAAKNPASTAAGLMQFLDSTWASTPYAQLDPYSPYASALAAGWMIAVAGRGGEWDCR